MSRPTVSRGISWSVTRKPCGRRLCGCGLKEWNGRRPPKIQAGPASAAGPQNEPRTVREAAACCTRHSYRRRSNPAPPVAVPRRRGGSPRAGAEFGLVDPTLGVPTLCSPPAGRTFSGLARCLDHVRQSGRVETTERMTLAIQSASAQSCSQNGHCVPRLQA